MKETEFFQWWITDPGKKKPRLTRWKMDREEALRRFPGATPYEPSREVRNLPESAAEVTLPRAGRSGPLVTTGMGSVAGQEGGVKPPSNGL